MVVQLAGGNFLSCSNLMAFMHMSRYSSSMVWHPVKATKCGPNDSNKQPTQIAWQADWACDKKPELGKSFSHSCPFSVPLIDFSTSQVRLLNKGYCVLDGVLEDFENSVLCLQSASQNQSQLSNSLLPMHAEFLHLFYLPI